MKISFQWLKSYLSFDLDAETTARYLTDCGLEVENIETFQSVPGGLRGLVVGEVVKKEKHPNADKLSLTKVNTGNGHELSIVCGAPNVAEGQKVIVAPVGTVIKPVKGESFEIKKAKIRGELSEGMLCADDEVGLGEDHSGIRVLPADWQPGKALTEYIPVEEDLVFEIGLTPNRGDATSHMGVARDLYAVLQHHGVKASLNLPQIKDLQKVDGAVKIDVEVLDPEACPRYSGLVLEGITIGPSPDWLQNRLKAIGLQPISNVVDITNFVLHETGQPLHAFDAGKIKGNKVVVQCLPEGTNFVTLDEKTRKLKSTDLMICDTEGGMCIAGVFGGIHSGISDQTTSVFLESACFNPTYIRRTSSHHELKTDASFRFERGSDPEATLLALNRAAQLICELAGGKVTSDITDIYPKKIEPREVKLRISRVHRLLGKVIEPNVIENILKSLQFGISVNGTEGWTVKVPTFKTEVTREVDVIEEILRIYGCLGIEPSTHSVISYPSTNGWEPDTYRNAIADMLVANGFTEIMNNSMISDKRLNLFPPPEGCEPAAMLNPLSSDLSVMRTSMIPGGMETILHNLNRKNRNLTLFEFGRVYALAKGKKEADDYREKTQLALFSTGVQTSMSWSGEAPSADFFYLKSATETILTRLGISLRHEQVISNNTLYREAIQCTTGKDEIVATVGTASQAILDHFDIQQDVVVSIIEWDVVLAALKQREVTTYREVSRFPAVKRDLALLIPKETTYGELKDIAWKNGGNLLQDVSIFDVYEGNKLEQGKKSYALSFVFGHGERTLTDEEVEAAMTKLSKQFEKAGARVRAS
ncbi:MAG: phenylalanine--tRNA ligase subunit beta [Flavobacteriales bacterium]|nr:phenylalanine--tRNA ligase subunit beta [Flavobacteriales bacterium]